MGRPLAPLLFIPVALVDDGIRIQSHGENLIRRQVDEIIFQVGKQLRDRLRLVQRITRDHFTAIADEHHRSLADSVLAAQKAANMYASDRDRRIQQLRADLKQVDALSSRAKSIDGAAVAASRARHATSSAASIDTAQAAGGGQA